LQIRSLVKMTYSFTSFFVDVVLQRPTLDQGPPLVFGAFSEG